MQRPFRAFSLTTIALLIGIVVFAINPVTSGRTLAQGNQQTIVKSLPPFTSVQINGGGQALLRFGPEPSVTIEGNSWIVDRLDAKVEHGTLILGSLLTVALDVTGLSDLRYTIVTPSIEEIHLSGTIDLHIEPMPNQSSLVLGLTTGAEVFIPSITAGIISGKLDLLSTAHLAGTADSLQMQVFGGSKLDARNLQTVSTDLQVKGLSNAIVRVTESLTGTASEGATVSYITQTVNPTLTATALATLEPLPYIPWTAPVTTTPTQ